MFASLNGVRCQSLTLTIPSRGLWTADAVLTNPLSDGGTATLIVAGLTLIGAFIRSADFLENGFARLVGGHGGWHQTIPEKYYQSPFGLRLTPILTDAASACGESVAVTTDSNVGNYYVRRNTTAARVLNQLCPEWWVRPDGVTQIGPRTTPIISSRFDVIADGTNLASGRVQIATDKPEDWVPGCLFTAPTLPAQRQVSTVIHTLTSNKLRTTIWTSP